MAISDKRFLEARARGEVVVHPFRDEQLGTSSYDVCLGPFFYREQHPPLPGAIFNIYDPEHVAKVWGELQTAPTLEELRLNEPMANLDPHDRIIMLAPGETILAHTEEFIGGRVQFTSMMKARSSFGRSFITVCKCAGWGDVGYINRWTFEITNVSQHYRVPLVVGEPIAQIIIDETGPIRGDDYGTTGNYQGTTDIEILINSWSPTSMLPRTKRKRRVTALEALERTNKR